MGQLSNARHERFAEELEKTVPLRLVRCRRRRQVEVRRGLRHVRRALSRG